MRILQLEASNGWGGQEIRTLKEVLSLRERGHTVLFATSKSATLGEKAKDEGFRVETIPFERKQFLATLFYLIRLILQEKIDVVCTHSSWDGWIGGIAARLTGRKVLRTRHLSTPIKKGLNSYLLYNTLADQVITTCERVAETIRLQARLPATRCRSIPTGVEIKDTNASVKWDLPEDAFLVGTACILRSWKGLMPLLQSIAPLENVYLVIIGDGPMRSHLEEEAKKLGVYDRVIFTGFLEDPFPAIKSLDLFALLSTAHEGVSQATLQAAWLEKPLLTTPIGGLDEVCVPGKTGLLVPPNDPEKTSEAIRQLKENPDLKTMGHNAKNLVSEKFLFEKTMGSIALVYDSLHQA